MTSSAASMLLKIHAVTYRFNPPYTYTSGIKSPMYIDNRLIISYPDVRKKIISYYVRIIKEHIGLEQVDYISATATAAIPHGAWIADSLNLPMVFVRSGAKTHGKGTKMEGYLEPGSKVVVIEDLISTAKSSVGNAQTIREAGGIVEYCVATIDYETEKAKLAIRENNLKLLTITTSKNVLNTALEEKYISKKEEQDVLEWFKDPIHWGDRFNK